MTTLESLEAKLDAIAADLNIDRRKAKQAQALAQEIHPLRMERVEKLLGEIIDKHGTRKAVALLEELAGREPRP